MESFVFNADDVDEDAVGTLHKGILNEIPNEDLVTKILFGSAEPPRFVMLIGMNQIALVDRNKWNEKRYLQFELEEIFSRLENTTLQAMAVLLHKDSLCPDDGRVLLDELDEQSQKNASGVSQDLKYALRESIELLGNEVLYDMKTRLGRDLDANPVDAGQLTLECLRYMYRMLFVLFIESRPELGYAPIKAQSYYSGYSLESLRDIADNVRDDVNEVGDGYYLHETLAKLYELIYDGYPKTEEELKKATGSNSLHDLFAERGGFDLIIGNPPWIKITWNEKSVLADRHPMFAVKELTAKETAVHREKTLKSFSTYNTYLEEYVSVTGEQAFLNAVQNYPDLRGQQTNLFRCFLPLAWDNGTSTGVSAFVHPNGVFDDPKGTTLRKRLYKKLRYHFQFENELNLFEGTNDHGRMRFSLNVYCNQTSKKIDVISNLFSPSTISECYETPKSDVLPGIKDQNGDWNTRGHPDRIVTVGKKELLLFARLFDGNDDWETARLPVLHAKQLVGFLEQFSNQERTFENIRDDICVSVMWDETNAQKSGIIQRNIHFPDELIQTIYSGPHISIANPLFKTSRSKCVYNSDYDNIDLDYVNDSYIQRCNYQQSCSSNEYYNKMPSTPWGTPYNSNYRLIMRRMLNQSGERTLIPAIVPPKTAHINTVIGLCMNDHKTLVLQSALFQSIIADGYIKVTGKMGMYGETLTKFPILPDTLADELRVRVLVLNCLTSNYAQLWKECYSSHYNNDSWSKQDRRLKNSFFEALSSNWRRSFSLRDDFTRRQALLEIDVLVAMSLGITLDQLCTLYNIQFPVLQSYEADTWYDANGRITFTNNRSLVGVGFDRKEFELNMKDAPAGKKFYRTIMDDTMPGGPVERTIEYVAPFDRCDREQDYETAWKFFEEKYGK